MKLSRATVALYLAVVFGSGAALGVFGNRYYEASKVEASKNKNRRNFTPEEFRRMYLAGMKKELLLSDEQVQKLTTILDETRSEMNDLHKRQLPDQQEIQRRQQEKIRALFDTVQIEKYDAMLKRMAERTKKTNKKN